jgi:hypothetical protein
MPASSPFTVRSACPNSGDTTGGPCVYALVDGTYCEATESQFFRAVDPQLVTEALERSKSEGQSAARFAVRQQLRARRVLS